jgi:hypothetical protein
VLLWLERRPHVSSGGRRSLGVLVAVALTVAGVGYVSTYQRTAATISQRQASVAAAQQELLFFTSAPQVVFERLYPPQPWIVPLYAGLLRHAALGPFADAAHRVPLTGSAPAGVLDGVTCESASGWALDAAHPLAVVRVEILAGTEVAGTVNAGTLRQDLRASGIGTGVYGFSIPIPERLRNGVRREIRARVAGTRVELQGTPKAIVCHAEELNPRTR